MRLEGQSKLGYYPTPDRSLALILTWLTTDGDEGLHRYLDPCCGEGHALAAVAAHLHPPLSRGQGGAETYGIELSDTRAEAAATLLDHVLNTAFENTVLTDATFSLALANPPYDGESMTGGGTRMEETFLLRTTPRLAADGVLIYLIPHSRINEKIARHLAGWYDNMRCFKLAGDDYDVFKQIVVFGRRRVVYQTPTSDAQRAVQAWASAQETCPERNRRITGYETAQEINPETGRPVKVHKPVLAPLPELHAGNGEYAIPVSPLKGKHGRAFRFQYTPVTDEDYVREAGVAAGRLDDSREWRDLIPVVESPIITPAMPPKRGHIAMQVNGGLLGTNLVRQPDGSALLLKGNVTKFTVRKDGATEVDPEPKPDDKKSCLFKVQLEERFRSVLATLAQAGELTTYTDAAEIGALLEKHVEQLAEIVEARNVPQYDMKPESWEWSAFDYLSLGRQLPGRAGVGLTDFQRHLAIALGRLCLTHGAGFMSAEMGSGKTTVGIAIAEYLRVALERRESHKAAYPALVVGPGIVTGQENWPKEVVEVTPGATARVVTIGAKPLPKPARIKDWLRDFGLALSREDEDDFEGKDAEQCLQMIMTLARQQDRDIPGTSTWERLLPLKPALRSALRHAWRPSHGLASAPGRGNPPNRRKGADAPNLLDGRIGGFLWFAHGIPVLRDKNHAKEVTRRYSLAQFIGEYRRGELPEKSFAIMSYETSKLGSGRAPAMNYRTIRVPRGPGHGTGWRDATREGGHRWPELECVCTCPDCGSIVSESYDDETGDPRTPITTAHAEQWIGLRRRFCQAPPRYFNPATRRYEPGQWVWDDDEGRMVIRTNDEHGNPYVCGAPLFQYTALRREAAARFVAKRARWFFPLLLVDEIHQAKAKGTGVGWALTVLSNACRYTVGLTGTLFGGHSTSIFWLFYRLAGEVRQQFRFDDERRWAEKYGLLKRTFYIEHKGDVAEDGAYTGVKHFENISERPGISPAIAGLGLKFCTFSSLHDVGLPLPDYDEEIVRLEMTEAMQSQYEDADGSQDSPPSGLLAWALETQKEETGKGAISVWLNTALNRPDAMFRPEQVFFNRRLRGAGRGRWAVRQRELVREFPAVAASGEWLPKEAWMAEQCLEERRHGRKTLVYVRQTGNRDIQPRLVECLQAHGLRAGVLKPSLAPRRRATWLKNNAHKYDVLLTNARLVQVGLNLTMFSTAIFAETEWSLYIVWQAMRRLYRPGAPLPVKLYFPVYEGALEERALDLIGAKMIAAQTFYGDEVSSAIADESDAGDLLHDLVRQALGQINVGRAEGLFNTCGERSRTIGNDRVETGSALGSPTLVSPTLRTVLDLYAIHGSQTKRRRRTRSVPQQQLVLL